MSNINYNNFVEAYRAAYPEKSKGRTIQFNSSSLE